MATDADRQRPASLTLGVPSVDVTWRGGNGVRGGSNFRAIATDDDGPTDAFAFVPSGCDS